LSAKTGFVSIIGKPNAGKSTLINWLVGEKLALVSQKANATRKRFLAILMHENNQIILIDTPGLHKKEKKLNQFMLQEALKAIGDCDLILFLAPITDSTKEYEQFLELNPKAPHILLLTKSDLYDEGKILKKIKEYEKFQNHFKALIPTSTKKSITKRAILDEIVKYLPIHPHLYDPENLTNAPIREIYREFIREAIFEKTSEEIPYVSDVLVEKVEEMYDLEKIYATIIIEKPSQKNILIGKSGTTISRIGKHARLLIEEFIKKKVFLKLFVAVKPGWTQDTKQLKKMGYHE
jgi:GTP-binding protein Era